MENETDNDMEKLETLILKREKERKCKKDMMQLNIKKLKKRG